MSGLMPALPTRTPVLWSEGQNIVFTEQSVQPSLAHVPIIGGVGAKVTHIQSNRIDSEPTLFWGDRNGLYSWTEAGGTLQRGSGYTGDDCDQWSIVNWGRFVVASNGVDPVQLYDPTNGVFLPLGGTTFGSADILVRHSAFLVAFNLGSGFGDTSVAWSDADDINTWVSSPANLAGDYFVRDMESEIIAALRFGDDIYFYGTDSVHRMVYRGVPNVFGFERLAANVGPVGKHAVTEVNRMHYGFSKKGIFMTNGFEFEFIDKPMIHDTIYNDINCDPKIQSGVVAWNDELEEHVVFFYPSEDSEVNNKAVAYNYRDKNWTQWNLGRSAAENVSVFPHGISADEFGNIYFQQVEPVTDAGEAKPFRICSTVEVKFGYGGQLYGAGGYGSTQAITNNVDSKSCEAVCKPGGLACGQVVIKNICCFTKNITYIPVLSNDPDLIYLQTKDLDLGTNDKLKTLEEIRVEVAPDVNDFEGSVGKLTLLVGTRDEFCDVLEWDGPYEIREDCPINVRLTAKYFTLRIEGARTLQRWQISAVDFFGTVSNTNR